MMGVFCATDFFLFYIFWEAMLIPMFLIIGVFTFTYTQRVVTGGTKAIGSSRATSAHSTDETGTALRPCTMRQSVIGATRAVACCSRETGTGWR